MISVVVVVVIVVDNDNDDKTRSFSKRSKPDLGRFFFGLRKHSAYRGRLNDLLPSAAITLSRIVFTTEQEIWVLELVTPYTKSGFGGLSPRGQRRVV